MGRRECPSLLRGDDFFNREGTQPGEKGESAESASRGDRAHTTWYTPGMRFKRREARWVSIRCVLDACGVRDHDTSNERKLPKCMDNRRGREHNFGTQRRSCFRVCIALAVVSMGALLSFVPAFGRGATRSGRKGWIAGAQCDHRRRARRAAASAPACGPTLAGKGHAGVKQGPTLDGLAEGVEGQRWRAKAAPASRVYARRAGRRRRGPTLAGKGRAGVKGQPDETSEPGSARAVCPPWGPEAMPAYLEGRGCAKPRPGSPGRAEARSMAIDGRQPQRVPSVRSPSERAGGHGCAPEGARFEPWAERSRPRWECWSPAAKTVARARAGRWCGRHQAGMAACGGSRSDARHKGP
jgi:hypothetical protein